MRPGPKFEITKDMAIENIRAVYQRINPPMMTLRVYIEHGSFSARAIERKWPWREICLEAGVPCGVRGSNKKPRHNCIECGASTCRYYCAVCIRRVRRQDRGMI